MAKKISSKKKTVAIKKPAKKPVLKSVKTKATPKKAPAPKKMSKKSLRALEIQKAQKELELKKIEEEKELKIQRQKDIEKLNVVLASSIARQLLIDLAGENTLAIIRNFQENQSDEDISKQLKLKISDVRATLNRLHSQGLVRYFSRKDNETGWYSYSWVLNHAKVDEWVQGRITEMSNMKEGDNYFCSSCGIDSVISFVHAAGTNFKCNQCSNDLEFLEQESWEKLTGLKK